MCPFLHMFFLLFFLHELNFFFLFYYLRLAYFSINIQKPNLEVRICIVWICVCVCFFALFTMKCCAMFDTKYEMPELLLMHTHTHSHIATHHEYRQNNNKKNPASKHLSKQTANTQNTSQSQQKASFIMHESLFFCLSHSRKRMFDFFCLSQCCNLHADTMDMCLSYPNSDQCSPSFRSYRLKCVTVVTFHFATRSIYNHRYMLVGVFSLVDNIVPLGIIQPVHFNHDFC